MATLQASLSGMSETQVASELTGPGNAAIDTMKAKLFDMETRLKELMQKYSEDHVQVRQLKNAIAESKRMFEAEQASRQQILTGRSTSYDETNLAVVRKTLNLMRSSSGSTVSNNCSMAKKQRWTS